MALAADTDEENLKFPSVQNLLKQSNYAVGGLLIIVAGTVLQIVGTIAG